MKENNTWLVQELRVSVFPTQEESNEVKDLWPSLKGIELEKESFDSKIGLRTKEGWYNKNRILLIMNPLKVDLLMSVAIPVRVEDSETKLEVLGDFEASVKEFILVVEQWMKDKNFPRINRIAFGGHLMQPAKSRQEGYKLLSKYVPYEIDPDKMTDFSLQLNLFKTSKTIKDLRLNRLTKWNVLVVTPELAVIGGAKITHEFKQLELAHLELDMNTAPLKTGSLDKAFDIFLELVGEGKELSEKGAVDNAN